ncbi:FkbM family methyltransferase [soil metagenome]
MSKILQKDAFTDQARLMPDARTIIDIGANSGQTSTRYRAIYPGARIHAFEPFPEAFAQLSAGFENDADVICHPKAVAEASGPQTLYSNTMAVTNALSPFREDAGQFLPKGVVSAQPIEIDATSLDDFAAAAKVERIDILKMDAQGSETRIIAGASHMLSKRRIGLVYSELMFVPVYQTQARFYEIASMLGAYGYQLFDFYGFEYGEDGQLKWGDAIFLPQAG